MSRKAILLLAHGAPERAEQVPEFLLNVRAGRPLPPKLVEEITERYRRIGGGSPLLRWTRRQAELLAAATSLPVYVGMRNWTPLIADAVRDLVADNAGELTAICLAPQNSRTSVGLYRKHLGAALGAAAARPGLRFVESWHDQPQLIAAFADRLRAALRTSAASDNRVPVIFTAHSVPERTIAEGDPYARETKETARLVAQAAALAPERWRIAYQSQGLSDEPWLGPTVESLIDQFAAGGSTRVVIHPIGFLCDNVEILYDVDIVFREYAARRGVAIIRPESLNDHPGLIAALRETALSTGNGGRSTGNEG